MSFRVAEIAGGGLELGDSRRRTGTSGVRDFQTLAAVWDHEDVSVGTIFGAQTAADAVILDHDLKVFAAVNGIHRTAGHAVRIGAGSACGRNEIISKTPAVPQ